MPAITLIHYTEDHGSGEYIILVEDEATESVIADNARPGFSVQTIAQVEGNDLHMLPIGAEMRKC